MRGVARSMFWTKVRVTAALVVLGIATAGFGWFASSMRAGQQAAPAPAQAKPDSPKEKERPLRGNWDDLEGDWDVLSVEDSGVRLEPKGPGGPGIVGKVGPGRAGFDEIHIIKDWFVLFLDGRLYAEWHITNLDPDADPKALHIQTARTLTARADAQGLFEHEGIYRVSSAGLMICVSKSSFADETSRPTEFPAPADSGQVVIILKRRAADDRRESRRRSLEGTWKVTSVEADGKPLSEAERGTRWKVTPSRIEWLNGDRVKKAFRYTSEPEHHQLDLNGDEGGPLKGFWLAGERGTVARVCFGMNGIESLKAPAGSGRTLVVLKRLTDPPAKASSGAR